MQQSDGSLLNFSVPVSASVRALASVSASTWGSSCDTSAAQRTANVVQGADLLLEVFSCDVDGLPTDHSLPTPYDSRQFTAHLAIDISSGSSLAPISVEHLGGARYQAAWRGSLLHGGGLGLGDFVLTLQLGGVTVGLPINVTVVCAFGLSVGPDGRCACPPGEERDANANTATSCTACLAGKHKSSVGDFPCSDCSFGTAENAEGARECSPCAAQTYSPATGATTCLACPERTNSSAGAAVCDVCARGFYKEDTATIASPATCHACLSLASCESNSTLATISLLPGHWRLTGRSNDISLCRTHNGPNGTGSVCLGGLNVGELGAGYCSEGHTGPKCEVCTVEGTYFDKDAGECRGCPSALSRIVPWLVLLAIAFGLGVGFSLELQVLSRGHTAVRNVLSSYDAGNVKQLLSFFQACD